MIGGNNRALYIVLFAGFLLINTVLNPIAFGSSDNQIQQCFSSLDGGWFEEKEGVKILHVSGSYYDMGYQHGYLLKEEINENIRAFSYYFQEYEWSYEKVLSVWNIQKMILPNCYIQELQGMADGSGISFEKLAVHNSWMGVYNHLFSCWGASLWGDATQNGTLLHMRSCDGINGLQDPISKSYVYENQILLIRNPDNAFSSLSPVFSGDVTSIGGFNEQGIGVSELSVVTEADTTFFGINAGYRMRMVLDFSSDAAEAVEIMNSNRTCSWNFIVSDAAAPLGCAIEQSANKAYTMSWFDAVEDTPPFWQIKDVVRRGNCYINPAMASLDRNRYNPSGVLGLLRFLLGIDSTFINWIQYKTISEEIEKQYGTIDEIRALELLRDVYLGNTNLFFRLFLANMSLTCRQWVGCPLTGDFYICFAKDNTEAYQNIIHHFNFFNLLNSEPP